MGLSCGCDFEPDPGDVVYSEPKDYAPLSTKRIRKCVSCGDVIKVGDLAIEFERYKIPETFIEEKIYGDGYDGGVPRASIYHCERCADLYLSLVELGYCVNPYEDQRELLCDYHDMRKGDGDD